MKTVFKGERQASVGLYAHKVPLAIGYRKTVYIKYNFLRTGVKKMWLDLAKLISLNCKQRKRGKTIIINLPTSGVLYHATLL